MEWRMLKPDDRPHFDVHPSVVLQLGESLISDAVQALIELVKNSYDADASFAKITIDTAGITSVEGTSEPLSGGLIIVQDDGSGMDKEEILGGWLLISNRSKRTLKQAMKTTPGGRTPLGDKGLGRLGVQKLGDQLDVFTKVKGGTPYHIGFSWLDFATAPTLADIDIQFGITKFERPKGTKIVVSSLREAELWRGDDALKRLQRELSRMISPFREIRNFIVAVEADGKTIDIEDISDKVRELAPVRYSIKFDGENLSFAGRARLDFFRPPNDKGAEEFALIAESDDGDRFYQYLKGQKRASYLNLKRAAAKKWFVEFRRDRNIEDLDRLEPDPQGNGRPANPGPFTGEVDAFDLSTSSFRVQNVFDRIKEFRDQIQRLSGIRVYRDGFAIRVGDDWLNLGAQWTSATSYYGLKPNNTVGYIALSARDNMQLEETTDREGFKDTSYYRNFYALLMDFQRFTSEAHEFFGRSWSDFSKARREQIARVDTRKGIEDISKDIRNALVEAPDQEVTVERFHARLSGSLGKAQTIVGKLAAAEQFTPALQRQARETLDSLNELALESGSVLERVASYLHRVQDLKGLGQVLDDRVGSLRRQVDDMYQTVALGLTAEAISHEVFQIADNLARRTKSLQTRAGLAADIESYLNHVQSSVMALRKQVSYMSPALRYVREKRDEIVVSSVIKEIADFYKARLEKVGIRIVIETGDGEEFVVWMNRGKLSQICDNFILNSEYWLKQDLAAKRVKAGLITFAVDRPFVRVFDNGRGIDPSVESALFEPFISAKSSNEGRGLGLFIVKQLLDSEGCQVGVVPERNRSNRLFKFQLDLRGALHE
jgi:signal transduction histidine kinase